MRLEIADLTPTWGMEIKYRLKGTDGRAIVGIIHNTIHAFAGPVKPKPVKVFILAGQSNMEGQAVADLDGKDYNDGKGTLNASAQGSGQGAARSSTSRTTRASGRCATTSGCATSERTNRSWPAR